MEGRTIVRPDWYSRSSISDRHYYLQWRAGQSSGQTSATPYEPAAPNYPSMEGRTIVRPDLVAQPRRITRQRPSMEGRTIVRPDHHAPTPPRSCPPTFNGGPDNRPARLVHYLYQRVITYLLQWRAGQSSGQTYRIGVEFVVAEITFNGGPDNRPARQGGHNNDGTPTTSFNGGPDNRPARQDPDGSPTGSVSILQWRAGQSSGQTARVIWGCLPACSRVLASGVGSRSF